jgi:hypothetical protein
MDKTSTHKQINRTLAVVNGGLNLKVDVHKAATLPKPKLLDQVRQAIRSAALQSQDRRKLRPLDQTIHFLSQ